MPGLLADFRFLLPSHPCRALVLGDLEDWRADLACVGVEIVHASERHRADLVVTPDTLWESAAALGCSALVRGQRRLGTFTGGAFHEQTFLALGGVNSPGLVIPLRRKHAAGYAIEIALPAPTVRQRVWNRLACEALARDFVPRRRSVVTLVTRRRAAPFLVAATSGLGLPRTLDWLLVRGRGRESTWRTKTGTFVLFEVGESRPRWVLKFPRFPGSDSLLAREEANLRRATSAGRNVAAHVPQRVGRLVADGFHASLDIAAPGLPLDSFLASKAPYRSKLDVIGALAAWTTELAVGTAQRADHVSGARSLGAERSHIPRVLQHDDLWPRNVFVDEGRFTVIDWEAATVGYPLWDLLGFLIGSLPLVSKHKPQDSQQQVRFLIDLFLGRSELSSLLFRWVRTTARALALSPADVGTITTLYVLDSRYRPWPRAAFAHAWLGTVGLGPAWKAWLDVER